AAAGRAREADGTAPLAIHVVVVYACASTVPLVTFGAPPTRSGAFSPTHSRALSTDSFTPVSSSQIVIVVSVPSPPSIRYQAWKPAISQTMGVNPLLP